MVAARRVKGFLSWKKMHIFETAQGMRAHGQKLKTDGKSMGFVPTMGAIHEGHLSLVRRSDAENEVTVVSIFVNPTQFGPREDFSRYPRELESDLAKLTSSGVDVVFAPPVGEMYREGDRVALDAGEAGRKLCGISRPGHFNGVATVVAKLFNIVNPEKAYFGQKDYQQTVVIRNMVRDLHFDVEIVICPSVREDDGLAVSSRNRYLDREARVRARILYRALMLGEELIRSGEIDDPSRIRHKMEQVIRTEPMVKPEYVEIVDPDSLERVERIRGPVLIALAVTIKGTRLIDNLVVGQM